MSRPKQNVWSGKAPGRDTSCGSREEKKDSDEKETVPNANYLWISYFATALNENGRAALVMANSASDAGNSEYDIRKKMIEAGIIKQMVTLPSNMFSSVTLPATLWFFDNAKKEVYIDLDGKYEAVGGELEAAGDKSDTCVVSAFTIFVDDAEVEVAVYNIGGNNYFKLRDLGDAIGFKVDYDAAARTVEIIS